MRIRAFLYDLARNLRADMQNLEYVIDTLADLNFNALLINLEYKFKFRSCPGLGTKSGLTPEMARELVAYGHTRGVTVIPQLNVIGHCEGITATERYAHLGCAIAHSDQRSGAEQLNLELPETRDLVRRIIEETCEAFPGDAIHLGCDEIRQMRHIFPDDPERQVTAMGEYVSFIISIAQSLGRQVCIWGDMVMQHQELLACLPKETIICDWHYGNDNRRHTLQAFKDYGFRVWASPGICTYSHFVVDPDVVYRNYSNMIFDARDLNLDGVLLTTWEFGMGSGYDIVWPWVAMASEFMAGRPVKGWRSFIGPFTDKRYGVTGEKILRLYELLCRDFEDTARGYHSNLDPSHHVRANYLRKALFRGQVPGYSRLITPLAIWFLLRTLVSEEMITELTASTAEIESLVKEIRAEATCNQRELLPLLSLADASSILVTHLKLILEAREAYKQAAMAQGIDKQKFNDAMVITITKLTALDAGLRRLEQIVEEIGLTNSFDEWEVGWIAAQMDDLAKRVSKLRSLVFEGDTMIEFGEFFTRPVQLGMQRVVWR